MSRLSSYGIGPRSRAGLGLLALSIGAGCSYEATVISLSEPPADAPSMQNPDGSSLGRLYALETSVYGPDDSVTSYVTYRFWCRLR